MEDAIEPELEAVADYTTFEYGTKLPIHVGQITSRVVRQEKLDTDGLFLQYKARLVAHFFLKYPGYDYHQSSSPSVDLHPVRLLLSVSGTNDADTSHVNVKSAFLEAELDEEILLSLPATLDRDTAIQIIFVDINAPAEDIL